MAIIRLYVNDCLILTHPELLQQTKEVLSNRFPVKDLKEPTSILGIEIIVIELVEHWSCDRVGTSALC